MCHGRAAAVLDRLDRTMTVNTTAKCRQRPRLRSDRGRLGPLDGGHAVRPAGRGRRLACVAACGRALSDPLDSVALATVGLIVVTAACSVRWLWTRGQAVSPVGQIANLPERSPMRNRSEQRQVGNLPHAPTPIARAIRSCFPRPSCSWDCRSACRTRRWADCWRSGC